METTLHRSERSKKPKQIFSPSNPLQPYYYLVTYDHPKKYRIVGRTSIQKITNDKAIVSNVDGEVQIITSGKIVRCSNCYRWNNNKNITLQFSQVLWIIVKEN